MDKSAIKKAIEFGTLPFDAIDEEILAKYGGAVGSRTPFSGLIITLPWSSPQKNRGNKRSLPEKGN